MGKLFEVRRIRPGDEEELIARGIRPEDEREAFKVSGMNGSDALRLSVAHSELSAGVFIKGEMAAVCGVSSLGMISGTGVPWLVAHPDFEGRETSVYALRASRKMIETWAGEYARLENLADPEHKKSIRYLGWLGFRFCWGEDVRGPLGHRLVRFWR